MKRQCCQDLQESQLAEMIWGGFAAQQARWRQDLHSRPTKQRKAVNNMRIRAKMQVQSITLNGYSETVKLHAVYGGDKNTEDNSFSKATPSATLEMQIDNPS